ncbi:MAG: hypothetical protein ACT4O9_04070 [Blastocatellia bacterium]
MNEAEVKFEREQLTGIVPVGSYLTDAARRFGFRPYLECDTASGIHACDLSVLSGSELLSPITSAEKEHFSDSGRKNGNRLGCYARIEKPGEIVVMTEENKKAEQASEAPETDAGEEFKKEFTELPLENKFAKLVELEAIALGETFSYVLNAPFTIADKVMDVMADFGFKKEEQEKKTAQPNGSTSEEGEKQSSEKSKGKNQHKKKGDEAK